MSRRRAVFFDRDGTLMDEVEYCSDPAKVRVIPGTPEALGELKRAGFLTVIISNQSGIGRGWFTEAEFQAVQEELQRQLAQGSLGAGGGPLIDAAYFCADPPGVPSLRRKPAPGMILEAAADLQIDLASSFMVGDKALDVESGRRAGTRTILVRTGYGADVERNPDFEPADFVADDVADAVRWILGLQAPAARANPPA